MRPPARDCGLQLEGLRALVTASTRGIGAGIARILYSCGAYVAVNGRDPERTARAASALGPRAVGIAGDLREHGSGARIVEEAARLLGGLDALIYVPPPVPRGGVLDLPLEAWRESYRLLVEAAIEAVRAAVAYLEGSGNPSITFVTSIAAWEPLPGIASSSVLRPGLHSLAVLLARELGPRGVRVNALVPGYFMTDRLLSIARDRGERSGRRPEEVLREIAGSIPLGRIGSAEEIGWAAAFLASPRASYVTGAIIPVTGGLHRSVR